VNKLLAPSGTFFAGGAVIFELVFVLEKVKQIKRELIRQAIPAIMAQDMYAAHPKLSRTDQYLSVPARRRKAAPVYRTGTCPCSFRPNCLPEPVKPLEPI
jgi:hypothetical protein